ncbi:lipase family protein [Roseateles sp. P5_E7]
MSDDYTHSPIDLFFPEKTPPVFAPDAKPDEMALAIEAARLAYFRFEGGEEARRPLEDSLRHLGFIEFAYFEAPVLDADALTVPDGPFKLPSVLKAAAPVADLAKNVLGTVFKAAEIVQSKVNEVAQAVHPSIRLFANPTDTQAFAAVSKDGGVLLAFRGSEANTLKDLLLDGQFLQVKAAGWEGLLHHGFARAASAIWPEIEEFLKRHPKSDLLITGHSLGAAIATLIAVRARRPNKTRLVTLGSPRVGDPAFVESFNTAGITCTRLVDCIDVVTRIPPTKVGSLEYQHVDSPAYIDRQGRVTKDPTGDNEPHLPLDLDKIANLLPTTLTFPPKNLIALPADLTDHATLNYLRAYWPPAKSPP